MILSDYSDYYLTLLVFNLSIRHLRVWHLLNGDNQKLAIKVQYKINKVFFTAACVISTLMFPQLSPAKHWLTLLYDTLRAITYYSAHSLPHKQVQINAQVCIGCSLWAPRVQGPLIGQIFFILNLLQCEQNKALVGPLEN